MAFGFGYLWAFFSIDPEEEVVIGLLHLFMLFLFPIIATAGVVGSVFRVVAAKGIPIIHKIMGVFLFLVVLFSWLMYSSLFNMAPYNRTLLWLLS